MRPFRFPKHLKHTVYIVSCAYNITSYPNIKHDFLEKVEAQFLNKSKKDSKRRIHVGLAKSSKLGFFKQKIATSTIYERWSFWFTTSFYWCSKHNNHKIGQENLPNLFNVSCPRGTPSFLNSKMVNKWNILTFILCNYIKCYKVYPRSNASCNNICIYVYIHTYTYMHAYMYK